MTVQVDDHTFYVAVDDEVDQLTGESELWVRVTHRCSWGKEEPVIGPIKEFAEHLAGQHGRHCPF